MKTRTIITQAAVASLFFALAACSTPPTSGAGPATLPALQQSPAQIAKQVCPIVTSVLTELQSPLIVMPASAKADVLIAAPVVSAVCAVGANVDATSLQSLANTAIPAIVRVVEQVPSVSQQAKDNIAVAQVLIGAIIAGQAGGMAPAPAAAAQVATTPAK